MALEWRIDSGFLPRKRRLTWEGQHKYIKPLSVVVKIYNGKSVETEKAEAVEVRFLFEKEMKKVLY